MQVRTQQSPIFGGGTSAAPYYFIGFPKLVARDCLLTVGYPFYRVIKVIWVKFLCVNCNLYLKNMKKKSESGFTLPLFFFFLNTLANALLLASLHPKNQLLFDRSALFAFHLSYNITGHHQNHSNHGHIPPFFF
jgi:hypothetical protein